MLVALAVLAALVTIAEAYDAAGFPRKVDGRWVRRAMTWCRYSLALPVPYMRGEMSWYYTVPDDRRVLHGQRVYRHRNGRYAWLAEYRDGRFVGTATRWNEHGVKTKTSALGNSASSRSLDARAHDARIAVGPRERISVCPSLCPRGPKTASFHPI